MPSFLPLLAAVLLAEAAAWWWMRPPENLTEHPLLTLPEIPLLRPSPFGQKASNPVLSIVPLSKDFQDVKRKLKCSEGQIAKLDFAEGNSAYIAYFEWNKVSVAAQLHALDHLPERCMGSSGLVLLSFEPTKTFVLEDQRIHFDHTVFRDPKGKIVHVFKAPWMEDSPHLLSETRELRSLTGTRLSALNWKEPLGTLKNMRPASRYARVIMGTFTDFPDGSSAWEAFEKTILSRLILTSSRS